VRNALAATACALAAGVPLEAIAAGLEAFEPVKGRSRAAVAQPWRARLTLVDDSYNANPDSVRAAIDVLAELPGPAPAGAGRHGRGGRAGPGLPRRGAAPRAGARHRRCCHAGRANRRSPRWAQAGGRLQLFQRFEALQAARAGLPRLASVLVKGSRFMRMERVVSAALACARHEPQEGHHAASLAHLAAGLSPEFGFLRVFQYLTFRAVMAAMTACWSAWRRARGSSAALTALKIGQPMRGYGMQTHLSKSGTPTMGGVLILLRSPSPRCCGSTWSNRFVWIVLMVTLGFGAIGWVDDWRKVVHKDPEGMRSREKYFWQSVIGLIAALYLVFSISESSNSGCWSCFHLGAVRLRRGPARPRPA
jgi:hypothetical protein